MTNDKLEKEMRKEEINDVYEEGEIYAQIALSGERIQESKVWIDKIDNEYHYLDRKEIVEHFTAGLKEELSNIGEEAGKEYGKENPIDPNTDHNWVDWRENELQESEVIKTAREEALQEHIHDSVESMFVYDVIKKGFENGFNTGLIKTHPDNNDSIKI